MSSGEILGFLGVYKTLKLSCRPSDILEIEDNYTAYCFDEACAFIISKLKAGETPIIKEKSEERTYSKPSDFYKKFDK